MIPLGVFRSLGFVNHREVKAAIRAGLTSMAKIARDEPGLTPMECSTMPPSLKKHAESRITAKQEKAAVALASGRTVHDAALATGAADRTVYQWLQSPDFRAAIGEMRDRLLSEAIGKLSEAASAAVVRLRALVDDETATIALRASVAVLDALVKVREFGELSERVAALQEQINVLTKEH